MTVQTLQSKLDMAAEELGLPLDESDLYFHEPAEWNSMIKNGLLSPNARGVYLPRQKEAHVRRQENVLEIAAHEYVGHGTFFEHSKVGQDIARLARQLTMPDKPSETVSYLKTNRKHKQRLRTQRNLIEGYALWTEQRTLHYLNETALAQKRWDKYNAAEKRELNFLWNIERKTGVLGVKATMGLPKEYDESDIEKMVSERNGKEPALCLLYGSQKPYSDIDLFIVSDDISSRPNNWLDIYAVTKQSFQDNIEALSLETTDAVITGSYVSGNRSLLRNAQDEIQQKHPTRYHARFNYERSIRQQRVWEKTREPRAKSYAESYRQNAQALRNGEKPLTYDRLQSQT